MRVLATHSIRQFPLQFPSRASPCATRFRTSSTTLHVSGSLSAHHQEFLAVHRLWYILCSSDEPFATKSRMELSSILLLVANGHHNCIKCTNADVRLRTPDDERKGCPKHVEQ